MIDSESSKKQSGVPSWQLPPNSVNAKSDEHSSAPQPTREAVIEQAKRFLEEDEVRHASEDKKISFLESKGLSQQEIRGLLDSLAGSDASPSPLSTPSSEISRPTTTLPPNNVHAELHRTRDTPPIITYPEFLTTPPSQKPIVTRRRLLTTLYLFSGLTALLYGTNNYLVIPMLTTLTESRLSLAETAKENLQKLIGKLEAAVSEIPVSHKEVRHEDAEESDEDPTEMFHRDIGTQTTIPSNPASPEIKDGVSSALDDQTTRLSGLKTTLSSLIEDFGCEAQDVDGLNSTITNLRDYLDSLAFSIPGFGLGHGGFSTGGYSITGGAGSVRNNDGDDEIAKVKAGIMGVKGVLLSARSFPRGVAMGTAAKVR